MRRQRAIDLRAVQSRWISQHLQRAHQFRVLLAQFQHVQPHAETTQHIQQAGTRGIHAHPVQHQVRFRKQCRGAQKKCRRGQIARHARIDSMQLLPALNADRQFAPLHLGAKRAQRQLAVVPRMYRLMHLRDAARLQSGKQQAGLHLRAGDGRLIVQAAQRTTVDRDWRMSLR